MWGFDNWDWDYFFIGAIKGGVSGALAAGVGVVFDGATGFASGVLQAITHGHVQGTFSAMTGGDYATTFITSVVASGVGSVLAPLQEDAILAYLAFDATIGGVTSEVMGGDFWEGFTTSLMIVGLNHCGELLKTGTDNLLHDSKINRTFRQAYRFMGRPEPVSSIYSPSLSFIGTMTYKAAWSVGGEAYRGFANEAVRQSFEGAFRHSEYAMTLSFFKTGNMKLGKCAKFGGLAFTAWALNDVRVQYNNGEISKGWASVEVGAIAIGEIPIIGTAWSIGWESGRAISTTTRWQNFAHPKPQAIMPAYIKELGL